MLFVNDVYYAVRKGKNWGRTLLIITFDEHGGLCDHVVPATNATPPDKESREEGEFGFRFDRFGPRVPTLFISPYVEEATVIRAPGKTPFDHTSIIKTICNRWGLEGLTDRDKAAPDFGAVLSRNEDTPRLETPTFEPRPYKKMPEPKAHRAPLGHLGRHATPAPTSTTGDLSPVATPSCARASWTTATARLRSRFLACACLIRSSRTGSSNVVHQVWRGAWPSSSARRSHRGDILPPG